MASSLQDMAETGGHARILCWDSATGASDIGLCVTVADAQRQTCANFILFFLIDCIGVDLGANKLTVRGSGIMGMAPSNSNFYAVFDGTGMENKRGGGG